MILNTGKLFISIQFALFLTCLAIMPSGLNSFSPIRVRSNCNNKPYLPWTVPLIALGVSNQGMEEDLVSDDDQLLLNDPGLKRKKPNQMLNNDDATWQQIKGINNKFWDYTCNFLYIGISCLILLNISGFGYTITREEGLRVMPLKTYRLERQWQEEIQRQQAIHSQSSTRPMTAIQNAPAVYFASGAKAPITNYQ